MRMLKTHIQKDYVVALWESRKANMISVSYPLSLSSYMAAFHTRPFFLLIKRHAQNTHSLVDPFQKDNLCSSTYSGLNAGSEPETNAIMEYFKYVSLRIVYMV